MSDFIKVHTCTITTHYDDEPSYADVFVGTTMDHAKGKALINARLRALEVYVNEDDEELYPDWNTFTSVEDIITAVNEVAFMDHSEIDYGVDFLPVSDLVYEDPTSAFVDGEWVAFDGHKNCEVAR